MEYVGIDLHKKESQICLLTETGEVMERRIRTEPQRFAEVLGGRPRTRILGSPAAARPPRLPGRGRIHGQLPVDLDLWRHVVERVLRRAQDRCRRGAAAQEKDREHHHAGASFIACPPSLTIRVTNPRHGNIKAPEALTPYGALRVVAGGGDALDGTKATLSSCRRGQWGSTAMVALQSGGPIAVDGVSRAYQQPKTFRRQGP